MNAKEIAEKMAMDCAGEYWANESQDIAKSIKQSIPLELLITVAQGAAKAHCRYDEAIEMYEALMKLKEAMEERNIEL